MGWIAVDWNVSQRHVSMELGSMGTIAQYVCTDLACCVPCLPLAARGDMKAATGLSRSSAAASSKGSGRMIIVELCLDWEVWMMRCGQGGDPQQTMVGHGSMAICRAAVTLLSYEPKCNATVNQSKLYFGSLDITPKLLADQFQWTELKYT